MSTAANQQTSRQRSRSEMSTRQLGVAAASRRRLTFHTDDREMLVGYLCGMDDYHWLVAVVEGERVHTELIHKGSAARVRIHDDYSLDDEPESIREKVQRIGGAFFRYCDNEFRGR